MPDSASCYPVLLVRNAFTFKELWLRWMHGWLSHSAMREFRRSYLGEHTPLWALFFSDIVSFVNLITSRSASFTDWSFGKVSTTSLSNRTKLVPSWKRYAYLPWTPSLSSSRRSYPERRSSLLSSLDFLFICLSLCTSKPSCTYDAVCLRFLRILMHQDPNTYLRKKPLNLSINIFNCIWNCQMQVKLFLINGFRQSCYLY